MNMISPALLAAIICLAVAARAVAQAPATPAPERPKAAADVDRDAKRLYDQAVGAYFARHRVRPGITGWAQVNGRNAISWEEKFRFDVEYVERQSFCLDFRILLLTVVKVVKRNGISAEGRVTIDEFGITKTQSKENV
jgi:hypothetical protein